MDMNNKSPAINLQNVLAELEAAANDVRVSFLCIFAHSLTVDIRSLLLDRPVSDTAADRIYRLNEYMHQLTSCVNPMQRRSAAGDAELVGDIAESAKLWGLQSSVKRALTTAARNTLALKKPITAI